MSRDDPVGADEPMTDAQSGLATVQVPSLATLEAAEVQPWTVLCVDDEPSILSALRRVLRAEGCRLLTAQGGAEALAILATESVDVVVSDMRMPGMDGAQLLARVREEWPGTARILLTGYADMDATIAAINNGQIYRYIHKPWDEHELRLTVRQTAERQQLERERQRLQDLTLTQNQELQELNVSLEARVAERTAELSVANDRLKRNYLTVIRTFSGLLELRGGVLAAHGRGPGTADRADPGPVRGRLAARPWLHRYPGKRADHRADASRACGDECLPPSSGAGGPGSHGFGGHAGGDSHRAWAP